MLEYVRSLNKNSYSYRVVLPHAIAQGWGMRGVKKLRIVYDPNGDCLIIKPIVSNTNIK